MKQTALTKGAYGHTLNFAQVFSPDDQWVVYDTRNEDTHIQYTSTIEKVNIHTGEVVTLYTTPNQTKYGPGAGAVAYHPLEEKVIFIHGLLNCNERQPYGFTRRFGAIMKIGTKSFVHAEARSIHQPYAAGALRGGSHAHTWSADGQWVSFTYNDYIMECLEKSTNGHVKDLRTIGVMSPVKKVKIAVEDEENFSGEYFTTVAATVKEDPTRGSDEIERAFDECWVGQDGYVKANGVKQRRAVAFHGNVRNDNGDVVTEVFISDIPEDIMNANPGSPLEGTETTRPNVPSGLAQRRITFTTERKYPGIQGPRYRLRTSPDGSEVYFLMKDDVGIVQIFAAPAVGGKIRQVTHLDHSIQAQFNISPDGKRISLVADNSVWLVDITDGKATRITARASDESAPVGGALWSRNGNLLVFNRYEGSHDKRYLQIIKIDLE